MILIAAGIAVAIVGVPLAALGAYVGRMQDTGRHVHGSGRRSLRPRALLATAELRLRWWDWRPVRSWWLRQYRRADRKALAAEMAARRPGPAWNPTRLLGARHDTPDMTGPVVDSEPLEPACGDTDLTDATRRWLRTASIARRPVNGRNLGTQPRRTPHPSAADPVTPARTGDRPPWAITTTSQPALGDAPVYGQAPVAEVLEAERLAEAMIP